MSAQVEQGYKLTETVGVSEDWGSIELQYVAKIVDSLHQTPTFSEDGYAMVRVTDIKTGNLCLRGALKVSETIFSEFTKNYKPKRGDIALSRVGSYGVSSFVETDEPFCMGQNTVIIKPDLSARFLYYALNSENIKTQIEDLSYGSGYKSLSLKNIKELKIPLPPTKEEQNSIAAALSDMDALISGLDQLIAKKRDIKQAAMQQLLTGHQRLPGFSGEWEVKPMRTLGCTYGGLAGKTKSNFGHGDARYIPFMNVMTDTVIDPSWLEPVDIAPDEVQNLAKKGDLFFNGSSETPEEVGFCSVLLEDIPSLYLNSFCFGFRFNPSAKVNGLFFAYWFRSKPGRTVTSVLAQGATRYNIAKGAFMQLEIPQPSEEEQTAIATILSDMDGEISTLKIQCDKARQIKLGMMQELLTGRIRLI